ncbi:hypothetical protein GCM10023325_11640 [Sphingomonas lutea]
MRLLKLIEKNVGWLMSTSRGACARPSWRADTFHAPARPNTIPHGLCLEAPREWVVLDTFNMFSPRFENPQRLSAVAAMFQRNGAKTTSPDSSTIGQASHRCFAA